METDRNVRIDPHSLYEIEKRRAGCRFPFFCYCLSFGGEGEGLVPLHWHNDMEIFYTEAAGILYVNDRTCPVEPGDIAFINPGELHRTSRLSAGDMVHIVFDLSLLRTPDPHGGINEVIDDLAARKTRIRTRAERGTPLYEKLLPLIGRLTEYVEVPVPFGRESCRIQSALYALFSVFFEPADLPKRYLQDCMPQPPQRIRLCFLPIQPVLQLQPYQQYPRCLRPRLLARMFPFHSRPLPASVFQTRYLPECCSLRSALRLFPGARRSLQPRRPFPECLPKRFQEYSRSLPYSSSCSRYRPL